MPDQLAALDEQREFARRERDHVAVVSPERGEAISLEPLLEDAQAGAVPNEDLASLPSRVDEQKQIARERVAAEPLLHETEEPVVPLAEVDGLGVRVHAYRTAGAEDHPSARTRVITSATAAPSIRRPFGVTTASV